MRRLLHLYGFIVLLTFTPGCLIAKVYVSNRLADLNDMIHVSAATGKPVGFAANAGPAVLGAYVIGKTREKGIQHKVGLGSLNSVDTDATILGLIVPFSRGDAQLRFDKSYGKKLPAWGSMGVDMGFYGFGVGARVDFVETLDFILGLTTWDILKDDKPGGAR